MICLLDFLVHSQDKMEAEKLNKAAILSFKNSYAALVRPCPKCCILQLCHVRKTYMYSP